MDILAKMEQTKQIIAEIERLKAEIPYHENAWSVLNKLEIFINSLPAGEEQPSRDLESEIKLYQLRNPVINHSERSLNEFIKRVAIYFAKWREQQTINKARKWLAGNVINYIWKGSGGGIGIRDDFFIDFEKAMEDEQ